MSSYDFVKNGINGFIYPSKDYKKLHNILNHIFYNRNELNLISELALKTIPNYNKFVKIAIDRI